MDEPARADFQRIAGISKVLLEELLDAGFTQEEAMSLVRVWFGTSWAQAPVMMIAQAIAAGNMPPGMSRILTPKFAG